MGDGWRRQREAGMSIYIEWREEKTGRKVDEGKDGRKGKEDKRRLVCIAKREVTQRNIK